MEITCYDKYGRVIENIVQWDVGQSISIKGYDLTSYAPQIHFANANSEKALVVESVLSGGLLSCQVPNSLARENLPIIMYIYDAVGETGKTNTIIKIPVTPRPMPNDVVYTDDVGVISLTEVLRQAREYMNNSLNYSTKAKESEEKAKTSADAAKVSETNAAKSENVASSSATQAAQSAKEAKAYVGSPLVANTVSAMTDQTKIYVYTGSESGYTAGNWYYHNGSTWVSGGVYNSSAVNVDKTLTQDGYAADAKVTGDAVSSLKSDLGNYDSKLRSFKDVNATEIVSGKLLNLKNKSELDYKNSCYIKQIIPGFIHKIKVSGKSVSSKYDFNLGGFYNNDGILLGKFGNDDNTVYTDLELDVPNGTSFIYVNQANVSSDAYKKVKFLDVIEVVKNKEQTDKRFIDLEEKVLNNSELIDSCRKVTTSVNIHPQFNIVGYATRQPDTNGLIFNSAYGYRTDYIDVTNYKYIDATSYGNEYIWKVAFFDKDKKFLPSISIQGDSNVNELKNIEIPNDAVYVVVSTYSLAENNGEANIYNSNSIELKYDSKIADLKSRVTDVKNTVAELENKEHLFDNTEFALFHTFGVIGDSLSVGHTVSEDGHLTEGRNIYYSWGQYLARRLGNYCLNFGRSGVTSKLWMSPSEQYCYPRLVDPNNLCQAYIIALGANDASMTLGSIADVNFSDMTQNADTEYGWYAKVINAVRTTAPNAPIFLLTLPYPRNDDDNIKAINEMIRVFGSDRTHFGKIFVVDLDANYNEYFKNGKLLNQIGNTGWHLTSLGYMYASHVIQKALSKVIADNYSDFQDVFTLPYGSNTILD